jgi:hypothetical protein
MTSQNSWTDTQTSPLDNGDVQFDLAAIHDKCPYEPAEPSNEESICLAFPSRVPNIEIQLL